jgi:hypothetical protein
VVELKAIPRQAKPVTPADLDWLAVPRRRKITGRGCRDFRQQDARRGRALSVYLDASILVSLFTIDTLTARADAVLRARPPWLMVSDFAEAEFASAIARRVRMQLITSEEAHAAFSTFDAWIARTTTPLCATSLLRAGFLRRLD